MKPSDMVDAWEIRTTSSLCMTVKLLAVVSELIMIKITATINSDFFFYIKLFLHLVHHCSVLLKELTLVLCEFTVLYSLELNSRRVYILRPVRTCTHFNVCIIIIL